MEFYINLNLKANQELNLGLDSEHLLLLTFLMDKQKVKQYQNESISENGNIYFWLSPKVIGNDLPILTNFCKTDRAKIDKIRGMYKNLIDLGFMEAYHKNQEIARAYYTFTEKSSLLLTEKTVTPYEKNSKTLTKKTVTPYEKNSKTLTKKTVSPYDNLSKPLTEKTVSNSNTNNSITNNSITMNKEGENTPLTIENEFVDFEVVEKEKFVFDDDVPFSGDGMVDFLKWKQEKEKAENKANNLPLEEKKEKEKSSAKKEKKENPVLKSMIESYPDEESFVNAWGLRFGAKYPKVDASKGYNRILLYCETSGKLYADYVRVLFVWYTGESENKRKSYEYDERTKQSNYDILANMVANMDNSNSDVF